MYKTVSKQYGAVKIPKRLYRKRKHGDIKVLVWKGKPLEDFVELPGQFSKEMQCHNCREYFGFDETVGVFFALIQLGPRRQAKRFFCGKPCQDEWFRVLELNRESESN